VLAGAAVLCAALAGMGLWAARVSDRPGATWTAGQKVSESMQHSGPVTMNRAVYEIEVGGIMRQWVELTPSTGVSSAMPVIVVLQGISATVDTEIRRDRFTSYDARLVYPVALYKSWNAGGCCGKAAKYGVNDVAFIQALVAAVNPGHTHAVTLVGYSNGGRLAYRLACTDPSLANIYAIVKAMPNGCVVSRRVTIVQIDSTNDTKVPLEPGDKGKESPAATVQVARLRKLDGASGPATVTRRGDLTLSVWQGVGGTRVAFAVYQGGGHSFPQATASTPSAAALIYSFVTGTVR
jgi:polyhydroxybutyrate depolymerase